MKRLFFFLITSVALSMAFVSCQKDLEELTDDELIQEIAFAENAESIDPADLPLTIKEYVDDYFFDTYVEEAFQVAERGYECQFGNGDIAYFNRNGQPLMFRGPFGNNGPFGQHGPHGPCWPGHHWGELVDVEDLPVTITDYITENYPDSEIRRAKLRGERYIVLVEGPVVLVFDIDGNFIEERNILFHCLRHCQRIEFEELSDVIATYVTDNYADAEFKAACERPVRTYVFMRTEEGRLILVFNTETGEFLFSRP